MKTSNSIIIDGIKYIIEKPTYFDDSSFCSNNNNLVVCRYNEVGTNNIVIAYLNWDEKSRCYEINSVGGMRLAKYGNTELLRWIYEFVTYVGTEHTADCYKFKNSNIGILYDVACSILYDDSCFYYLKRFEQAVLDAIKQADKDGLQEVVVSFDGDFYCVREYSRFKNQLEHRDYIEIISQSPLTFKLKET